MTILFVGRKEFFKKGVFRYLKNKGYESIVAESYEESLKQLENKKARYDLLISEIQGERRKNIQFFKRVKKIGNDLPIIIGLSLSDKKKAVELLDRGIFAYIITPFEPEELLNLIQKAILFRNLHRELAFLKDQLKKLEGRDPVGNDHMVSTENSSISLAQFKNFLDNMISLKTEGLYDIVINTVERLLITMILKKTKGNKTKSSKILGINRNTLQKKIASLKLSLLL